MLQFLKKLVFGADRSNLPAVPVGRRIYAIGDVHGRRDLLEAMVAAIDEHDSQAADVRATVIMLGDLVDRGDDSAGVVRLAREWQQQRDVRILLGNHEEMFLKSFAETEVLRHFLRHGGRQTIISYGADPAIFKSSSLGEIQAAMASAVPQEERDYIASFEDMVELGDYAFVHAGIDPQVALVAQRPQDLRWIREPFLSHAQPYEKVIVHGHSISDEPQDMGNRIGIDTGAYASGRLTALILEGTERSFLEVCDDGSGTVRSAIRRTVR